MGKKQHLKSKSEDNIQVDKEDIQKKTLEKYLPHTKFIKKRINMVRKHRNAAIKSINLDKIQIKKAVEALTKFAEENKNPADLFGEEGFIYLEVDTTRVPEDYSIRPTQIKLPFPIYSKQLHSRFTIFSSDPEADLTDRIDNFDIPMIREVIGYQKAKKNFKQLKDKRALLAANDLFFCDWRIYNLLRQPLGKLFYEKKKFPFPIQCNGQIPEELKEQYSTYQEYIQGLGDYTYFMMGNGPAYTLKVGRTSMESKNLVKNVMHGAYGLISNILGSDDKLLPEHIRQISIKTYNSPSLPIYNNLSKEEIKSFKKTQKVAKKNK